MKASTLIAVLLVASAGTVGYGAQSPAEPATHNMNQMMQEMQKNCPMHVPATNVTVEDTANGVAVSITTEAGKVADLRRRVRLMGKMHDANESKPAMMSTMIPRTIKYEDIPNGARLTLTPKALAQLEALRAQVRKHVERRQNGGCSMMQNMMNGMPEQPSEPDNESHDSHHPQ